MLTHSKLARLVSKPFATDLAFQVFTLGCFRVRIILPSMRGWTEYEIGLQGLRLGSADLGLVLLLVVLLVLVLGSFVVSVAVFRLRLQGFHPPQSWCFLATAHVQISLSG